MYFGTGLMVGDSFTVGRFVHEIHFVFICWVTRTEHFKNVILIRKLLSVSYKQILLTLLKIDLYDLLVYFLYLQYFAFPKIVLFLKLFNSYITNHNIDQ